ncbi:replication-associated recombination protein A [Roseibacillus ishigakijimensis]|uniref:Replication-associated recombination protein A n=1 Tax=Roseibacillus ishigakijimensis TaxID=454146 RepID=A0A934RRV1_9BACT|nr:replication-associated recombination protein A [Roseibacillus ishigakijimensis]MBK1833376.1 replication-associated recombination protein A [Roseibacillus ishigakijimensis]
MSDLFGSDSHSPPPSHAVDPHQPLAARMRPRSLAEVRGQDHILAEGKLLRRAIESDRFSSLIFYGPPGTGKTTLATVIARSTGSRFEALNGVESNVAEIRAKIEQAASWQKLRNETTILFIDEIHRFNKAQQDVLLPHLERGTVRFIGATTHNPYFYINSPLVSRSQVFQLEHLSTADIVDLLRTAIADAERGLGHYEIEAQEDALRHLAEKADGDARKALTALELAVLSSPQEEKILLDLAVAEESIQQKAVLYDADGDQHYDTISAFIKSIRGSDPDAALYWLAKMLTAGEDPRFIARRLVIAASEDIGLADSSALQVAIAAQQALEFVGMPEGRIPLAHATVHLATAPKSNSAYAALGAALADVAANKTLAVPAHLQTRFRKKIATLSGADTAAMNYLYSHDYEGNFTPQAYLPEGRTYYEPSKNGMEKRIAERLDYWRSQQRPEA